MKDHRSLFLGQIFYIQSISPFAPIHPRLHHHVLFFVKVINIRLVLGQRLSILNQLEAHFAHYLQPPDVIAADLIGDITCPTHLAFPDNIFQFVIVANPALE